MSSFKELREIVWKANMELPAKGLVIYTFGNVSGIDRNKGVIAIKPSGVPYEDLSPDNLVLVDMDNNVVEGTLRPSSDTKTHTFLYKSFGEIGGIVHTHSPYATAWAQARKPIPCFGTTHADHLPGEVPCTRSLTEEQLQGDYETETGRQITDCFRDQSYEKTEMVLVASHGPFTWGRTPEIAAYNSVILEEISRIAYFTQTINPSVRQINQMLLNKHFFRKHGNDAYYGQKS